MSLRCYFCGKFLSQAHDKWEKELTHYVEYSSPLALEPPDPVPIHKTCRTGGKDAG